MVQVAVIDDSVELVGLIADVLTARGWGVALHTRADDLPQLLRQEQPDLILLDLRLGGRVRGWELLSEFDLDPILHHVPVIICSAARNELRDRTTWLAERGIESLEKPFDIDDLYRAVDAALGAGASELC